ncbi:uncharacterized protein LOC144128250 [Amblyomma americanum]
MGDAADARRARAREARRLRRQDPAVLAAEREADRRRNKTEERRASRALQQRERRRRQRLENGPFRTAVSDEVRARRAALERARRKRQREAVAQAPDPADGLTRQLLSSANILSPNQAKHATVAAGSSSQNSGGSRQHGQGFLEGRNHGVVIGTCGVCGSSITSLPVPGVSVQTEAKHEVTQTAALTCARGTQTRNR